MHKKVIVIGLDGMSWLFIKKAIDYGIMPFWARKFKESFKATIVSIPPYTPPAWISLQTGVNPGKHGIIDFIDYETGRINNSLNIKSARIFDMLSVMQKKSIVFNALFTYPILNKKYVYTFTDRFSPRIAYYPEYFWKHIAKEYIPYANTWIDSNIDIKHNIKKIIEGFKIRAKLVTELFNEDYSLLWVEFQEPDLIFHIALDKVASMDSSIVELFRIIDHALKEAYESADYVLVISDHGFSIYRYVINLPYVLWKHNLLKIEFVDKKDTNKVGFDLIYERTIKSKITSIPQNRAKEIFSSVFIKLINGIISNRNVLSKILLENEKIANRIVRLYRKISGSNLAIRIDSNIIKFTYHEAWGIFCKNKIYKQYIHKILKNVRGLRTVTYSEDIFKGSYISKLPDIIYIPDTNNGYTTKKIDETFVFKEVIREYIFDHHPYGIFSLFSDNEDFDNQNTKINKFIRPYDVVPTILYLLDLPLPLETDGSPILVKQSTLQEKIKFYPYNRKWKLIRKIYRIKY